MRVVLFYHSLESDWNHGNAHFLRGLVWELQARGHTVTVYEPEAGWSRANLVGEHGETALAGFRAAYPGFAGVLYDPATLDLPATVEGADLVIVHEWNEHDLVRRVGDACASIRTDSKPVLLFHDTHHRAVTDRASMAAYDLRRYDGVLAFGAILRDRYLAEGWTRRAWVWHEAADTRIFRPAAGAARQAMPDGATAMPEDGYAVGDLVWIGNWGDEERSRELHEFLIEPVRRLGLRSTVYGVRYPPEALAALAAAGIRYAGWLPNYLAPAVFARHRVTVHVPRRPYTAVLPGIPTIRVFEALACGIPLVCAPWEDREGLFKPGPAYLVARDGDQMTQHLRAVLEDGHLARTLSDRGLRAIRERHTCAHRVDELLRIVAEVRSGEASTL